MGIRVGDIVPDAAVLTPQGARRLWSDYIDREFLLLIFLRHLV